MKYIIKEGKVKTYKAICPIVVVNLHLILLTAEVALR